MKTVRVLAAITCLAAMILLAVAFVFENHLLSFVGSGVVLLCALVNCFLTYSAKKKGRQKTEDASKTGDDTLS